MSWVIHDAANLELFVSLLEQNTVGVQMSVVQLLLAVLSVASAELQVRMRALECSGCSQGTFLANPMGIMRLMEFLGGQQVGCWLSSVTPVTGDAEE